MGIRDWSDRPGSNFTKEAAAISNGRLFLEANYTDLLNVKHMRHSLMAGKYYNGFRQSTPDAPASKGSRANSHYHIRIFLMQNKNIIMKVGCVRPTKSLSWK